MSEQKDEPQTEAETVGGRGDAKGMEPATRSAAVDTDATVVAPPRFDDAVDAPPPTRVEGAAPAPRDVDATALQAGPTAPKEEDAAGRTVPFEAGDAPVPSKRLDATQLASPESQAIGKPAPLIPAAPRRGEEPPGAEDPSVQRTNKLVLLGFAAAGTLIFTLLSIRSCAQSAPDPAPVVVGSAATSAPAPAESARAARFKVGDRVRVVAGDALVDGTILELGGAGYRVKLDSGAEETLGDDRVAGRALPSASPPPPPRKRPAPHAPASSAR